MSIILASASPRRRELLKEFFNEFAIVSPDVDESIVSKNPFEEAKRLSCLKADSIKDDNATIIASDTIVFLGGTFFGKPKDKDSAIEMLIALCGKTHQVISGIAIKHKGRIYADYDVTQVTIANMEREYIEEYVNKYQPYDKAGAYAIQDDFLPITYEGSYNNIVGLPTEKLGLMLMALGINN